MPDNSVRMEREKERKRVIMIRRTVDILDYSMPGHGFVAGQYVVEKTDFKKDFPKKVLGTNETRIQIEENGKPSPWYMAEGYRSV